MASGRRQRISRDSKVKKKVTRRKAGKGVTGRGNNMCEAPEVGKRETSLTEAKRRKEGRQECGNDGP